MADWIPRLVILVAAIPFIWYFIALSKNISKTEKEHGRDMTYEINPFTGMKMPSSEDEKKKEMD
ncbi:hypothetical protein M3210_11205 [Oceanobacillus luteolus]|uniref:DUF3951 domain-containing protein n=1 Tax=Oceanobacillus luteolus TaxID=1274358 RepID=A0ABW4HVK2_9BACI|nr:hypothetical protein [Oceanobacillus luteolus]MCM3740840.1 hypothetical protein [Oceanobacillus luteolus]